MTDKSRKHPLFLLLIALLAAGAACLGGVLVKHILNAAGILDTIPGRALQIIAVISLVLIAYRFYLRKFEFRGLIEYPADNWFKWTALGLAAGAVLILLQVGVLWAAGHYTIDSFQPSQAVVKYLFLMVLIGFLEELVTRGIIFRLVERWAGSLVALAVVTVEGGLTHATNPNASLWSSVAVGLEFGVLMSLVYMATRNLWTVSALHFAWNFTMGGIFDIAVSGTESQSLFKATLSGPSWLTGGAFGIEAGTPAVLLTIIVSVFLVVHLARNNEFRRGWRRNTDHEKERAI